MPDDNSDIVAKKLDLLRQAYSATLPDKLSALDKLWHSLREKWDTSELAELHRSVHSLAGSGGTFGFDELGKQARSIEKIIKGYLVNGEKPGNNDIEMLTGMFAELQTLSQITQEVTQTCKQVDTAVDMLLVQHDSRVIYLVGEGTTLSVSQHEQLSHYDYGITTYSEMAGLKSALEEKYPAVVAIDMDSFTETPSTIDDILKLNCIQNKVIPTAFFSLESDLKTRLDAVRNGGDVFFPKPVDIGSLVEYLNTITSSKEQTIYRVLVVDDELELADHYALVLQQAGMETVTLNQPLDIMKVLSEFKPDLILMDVYMPECTGLDLAKVIRQEAAYINLPIVFLSSEQDIEKQFSALQIGGDDFLSKPIQDDHLVSAVFARAKRSRTLGSLIMRDSLTGLLNHNKSKEQFHIELLRAKRRNFPISVAMLDIDNFKSVNDTYGHMFGDRVIYQLANLLQKRLRNTDIIGRYGGEEFIIVLPDTNGLTALYVLDKIRNEFAQLNLSCNTHTVNVTFSGGIASFPSYHSSEDLISAADEALYKSKHRGRNQIAVDDSQLSASKYAV